MNKAFTLIEVIVAISVMAIGVLGIYALVPRIVSISGANLNKFIASQLAREGIEIVRNIRDTNWLEQVSDSANPWNEGLTDCSTGCEADYNTPATEDPILTSYGQGRYLKVDADGFYNYENGTSTKFKRKITITPGADMLNIKVEIIWHGKGSPFQVEENLYDWR